MDNVESDIPYISFYSFGFLQNRMLNEIYFKSKNYQPFDSKWRK